MEGTARDKAGHSGHLVTEANRGIGRAVAAGYAAAGYAVAVTARDPATCAEVVAGIRAQGSFLSSAAAASITGEDLNVNAGVAMF